jgi:cardiolipin synthase A/B
MRLPRPRNLVSAIAIILILIGVGLVIAQDQETLRIRTPLAATDPRFPDYLATLIGKPLTAGDTYIVHTNGDQAFPAMLAAIDAAKSRIAFETYIFDTGRVAERFATALEAAARRGVSCQLVLDSVGASNMEVRTIEGLEAAGCRIGWFNQISSFAIEEVNYRTHRKALVVDGDVAFIGGIGIADQWLLDSEGSPRWRDTHFEMRGPAAINVEAAFHENWIETGGEVEPDLLLHTESAGKAQSIVVWSSPEGGANELKLLYLLAIAATRRTLDVQSPYLITDESTLWSLAEARKRGVRIRLLTEGDITDAKPVKFAGRADYERLMEQGMEVYEYQRSMMHAKAVIVDGTMAIIGSANFDNRSLELNDELNAAVFDRALARRLTSDFDSDLRSSKKLSLDEWRSRPLHIRGREKLWSFFGEVF